VIVSAVYCGLSVEKFFRIRLDLALLLYNVQGRTLPWPKNYGPTRPVADSAQPVYSSKFLGLACFRPAKVQARPGPARRPAHVVKSLTVRLTITVRTRVTLCTPNKIQIVNTNTHYYAM